MAVDARTPVIVGAGQVCQRVDDIAAARSPVALMADAARAAGIDAGLAALPNRVDSLRVVDLLSWRYRDPAAFVAAELGIASGETVRSTMGGNSPQALVNGAALDIAAGRADVVLLAGGETWRTRMRARRDGIDLATMPGWPAVPETVHPARVVGRELTMNTPAEIALGITMPVQVYPMFETALRAATGRDPDDHQVAVSELWARFAAVAAVNPYAWVRSAPTAEAIRTVGATNRMIGEPYPKLMNANNDVDQAAALLLCSAGAARALGVPEDRWVFLHSGTDCHEHDAVSERWSFAELPAVAAGAARALELAGCGIDDVELLDLYSCFPSAVQLGAAAIGVSLDRQLTRTGGLSFAGGPWNNYSMHAVATITGELRSAGAGARALVWANGGYATKHAFGIYGNRPPPGSFAFDDSIQTVLDASPRRAFANPADAAQAAGAVSVEAYTVVHDRGGAPAQTIAACRLGDGRRAWGASTDADLGRAFGTGEWVGRLVRLGPSGELRAR